MPIKPPWLLEHTEDIATWQFLLVRVIGLALVLWIVVKFIVPMLKGILTERQKAITVAAEQVEETLRDTETMRNTYRERLERIEDETQARMADAVREAEQLRERILEEAGQQAEGIVQRGEEEVAHERAKALINLRAQYVENIVRAAGYAASRAMESGQHRRLIEEFVENVGTKS